MSNQSDRSPWNIGRFLQTLAYFEVIPILSCLQRLLQGRIQDKKAKSGGDQNVGVILVAGATGGVGKRVVKRLVERGYSVRSLVRDAQRAKEMLSDRVEIVEADITLPETLTPQLMENVSAIICCTGVRVQPVEGDTPNREKYYQGISFIYLKSLIVLK